MQDDRLTKCLAAVRQVFGADTNPDQAFYDLGGNSLDAIQLTVQVKEVAGLDVNVYDMVNAESLAKFFQHSIDNDAALS